MSHDHEEHHDTRQEKDHAHHHSGHTHGFDPARLLAREDERRQIINPEVVMAEAIRSQDRTVADVGCGVGYFTLSGARRLSGGTFWAIDIHPDMVRVTLERVEQAGLTNVQGIVADSRALPLDAASVDLVFMGNVLHDFEDQEGALAEARRVLKPDGGRLFLVEWAKRLTDDGPPMEIRFSPEALRAALEAAKFTVPWVEDGPGPFFRALAQPSAHGA